jgi:N-glycosylase/DNA lyase|tara:strand:- start:580 stop:1200 length:621 start_codon:yes stop_codon:yes gene_type:complete
MNSLISQIKSLQKSQINKAVNHRLEEFSQFKSHPEESWFSELCFCILAANSKQKTAQKIQESLGSKLLTIPQQELAIFIRDNKHRFHNNKSKYIVAARQHKDIKSKLSNLNDHQSRIFLVNNIKGIGFKESSHFLRNTGSQNLAILDRHIINTLTEHNIIEKPKTLTPKVYLSIESKFSALAKKLNISSAKLDLLMWYLKKNEIAK